MAHVLRDGSTFTVCTDSVDHKFEADVRHYTNAETGAPQTRCTLYYEETHSDGEFLYLPEGPREAVWDEVCGSTELARFLQRKGVDTFRRGE